MIRYALTCESGHDFESWFADAAAFAALHGAGQLSCPVCGSARVEKALMAPAVRPARKAAPAEGTAPPPDLRPDLRQPQNDLEKAMAELRRQVEENSDYVGMNFAAEARRMHQGEAPERAIHGEAKPEEARALLAEGIPVAPLPFVPGRKTN